MNIRGILAGVMLAAAVTGCRAQEPRPVRPPAVAGQFYPADKPALAASVSALFGKAVMDHLPGSVAALILPHAGYVYSGAVAAEGFAQLDPEAEYENIFLLGSSHRIAFNGASVYTAGNFSTPLGVVPVAAEVGAALARDHPVFSSRTDAHETEHSLEVMLPFLQTRLHRPFRIVPIILGTGSVEVCKKVAQALQPHFTEKNLFVISSDFSHYPAWRTACRVDSITAAAIAAGSAEGFVDAIDRIRSERIPGLATSACGASSILTLLCLSEKEPDMDRRLLRYRNSGDADAGSKDAVVGYWAIAFSRRPHEVMIGFDDAGKRQLLRHARSTLERHLSGQRSAPVDSTAFPEAARRHGGAFVTLRTEDGDLRGCIGQFVATTPLYEVVREMAVAAATQDPRFPAVTRRELDDLEIEISVLTPMKRIASIDEFELGRHGIYMRKNGRSGTFLPQVAEETSWSREEFLGHCARDKVGIGWDGWKNAELYTYEAIVFRER